MKCRCAGLERGLVAGTIAIGSQRPTGLSGCPYCGSRGFLHTIASTMVQFHQRYGEPVHFAGEKLSGFRRTVEELKEFHLPIRVDEASLHITLVPRSQRARQLEEATDPIHRPAIA